MERRKDEKGWIGEQPTTRSGNFLFHEIYSLATFHPYFLKDLDHVYSDEHRSRLLAYQNFIYRDTNKLQVLYSLNLAPFVTPQLQLLI